MISSLRNGCSFFTRITTYFVAALLLVCSLPSFATEIEGARFYQDDNKARIVFELSENEKYTITELENPARLVIDIPNTQLKTDLKELRIDNTVINSIRPGTHRQFFRVVLDLNQKTRFNHFMLSPTEGYSYRLVLDMLKPKQGWKNTTTNKPMTTLVQTKSKKPTRDIVIVIDAGHGGKDSGARGPTGTMEKNVVLNISRQLKKCFDAQPGYRAVLTREGDYYVGLRERLAKARESKADLFVSIHADAFKNPRSRGASIYAVSEHGASSEAARWLAEKENYSELGRVNLVDKTDRLREVLINLSQAMTIAESLAIGNELLGKLQRFAQLHHEHVEQAPFVVLKSPDIPSVLVETGFISNPQEEARLKTSQYQQKLAKAIHTGITTYFKTHPPEDLHHTPVLKNVG